jgi:hypothetical protein
MPPPDDDLPPLPPSSPGPEPGEDVLDISFDDAPKPPAVLPPADGGLPPVSPVPAFVGGDVLVIDADDLSDAPPVGKALPGPELPTVGQYPPVGGYGYGAGLPGVKKARLAPSLVGSLLVQMVLAGAIGGFVAWAVTEPSARAGDLNPGRHQSIGAMLLEMALFGGAIGGFIAMALGAVEGVITAAWVRAVNGGLVGLAVGGAGGAVGAVLAQFLYSAAGGGHMATPMIQQLLVRAIGWAVIGAFIGLGPGLQMMATRKIINGLLGGLLGGFIGGALFDPISMVFGVLGGAAGTPSRLVGIVVTGLCTGLAIGMVEELRKEAWLLVAAGPLAGKQFILYKQETWIGSAPGMDIPLVKDQSIAPKQCVIEASGRGHTLRDAGSGGTMLSGRPVAESRLQSGDAIQIGATILHYQTRALSGPGA